MADPSSGIDLTAAGAVLRPEGDAPPQHSRLADPALGLFAVCAGMGGPNLADLACRTVMADLAEAVQSRRDTFTNFAAAPSADHRLAAREAVLECMEDVNERLHDLRMSEPDKRGLGASAAVVVQAGRYALLAHAGDARVYLQREGELHSLTLDQTIAREKLTRGNFNLDQAGEARRSSQLFHVLGRAESLPVETLIVELGEGDRLLLCTDGLWRHVTLTELRDLTANPDADEAADALNATASKGGATEAASVLVNINSVNAGENETPVAKRVGLLRRIPLFEKLDYRGLIKVLNVFDVQPYDDGQQIVTDGQVNDRLYIVLAGKVAVRKNGQNLATLEPGQFFGEMSLIDRAPASADIVCVGATRLMAITRANYEHLLVREPGIGIGMLGVFCATLSHRLRDTNIKLASGELTADDAPIEAGAGPLGELQSAATTAGAARRTTKRKKSGGRLARLLNIVLIAALIGLGAYHLKVTGQSVEEAATGLRHTATEAAANVHQRVTQEFDTVRNATTSATSSDGNATDAAPAEGTPAERPARPSPQVQADLKAMHTGSVTDRVARADRLAAADYPVEALNILKQLRQSVPLSELPSDIDLKLRELEGKADAKTRKNIFDFSE